MQAWDPVLVENWGKTVRKKDKAEIGCPIK
jgi:hypothetical protein